MWKEEIIVEEAKSKQNYLRAWTENMKNLQWFSMVTGKRSIESDLYAQYLLTYSPF